MTFLQSLQAWFFDHPFFGTLLVFMVTDVLLGILLSIQTRRLSSDVSRRGMTRKVVMLLLVLVSDFLARATGIPGARETSSIFFMTSELISILENAALLGVPIPPPLAAALIQLRQTTGLNDQTFRMGDSPQEHTRILEERRAPGKDKSQSDPITTAVDNASQGDV